MVRSIALALVPALSLFAVAWAAEPPAKDTFSTSAGALEISFLGHASLMFAFDGRIIQIDPFSEQADYSKLPKADLVLLTHEHRDHCDPKALASVSTPKTAVVSNEACAREMPNRTVMHNGDVLTVAGLRIEAVPAYNLVHMRSEGAPYHPKGAGNGYVITFGDKRVYVAGDTENIPEMSVLKGIDIAFLPMNLPYTMTPQMVAEAARLFHPKILYPYHYGDTDPEALAALLKSSGIEVRIRPLR